MSVWAWILKWFAESLLSGSKVEDNRVNVLVTQESSKVDPVLGSVGEYFNKYTECLAKACIEKDKCRIIGLARGEVSKGQFLSLEHNRVEILLLPEENENQNEFRLLSAYLISFFADNKQMMFSGLAINLESDKLLLEMTSDISTGNVRRDFRVVVRKDDGLEVRVAAGGNNFAPIPLDISFSGIMFETSSTVDLALDQEVTVTMTMAGFRASLDGEVRRKEGNKYGVFFPETPFSSGKDAVALRKIVKAVELYRLNQNRRIDID